MESFGKEVDIIWKCAGFLFLGFSMFALLTLSVERITARKYPLFHQTAVSKTRLIIFLFFLVALLFAFAPLLHFEQRTFSLANYVLISIFISLVLFILVHMNYKMFTNAKSKNENQTTTTTNTMKSTNNEKTKTRKKHVKNISACCLSVVSFFVYCFPKIVHCAWRLTSEKPSDRREVLLFSLRASTIMAMIWTFNSLIFFVKNSILRRE